MKDIFTNINFYFTVVTITVSVLTFYFNFYNRRKIIISDVIIDEEITNNPDLMFFSISFRIKQSKPIPYTVEYGYFKFKGTNTDYIDNGEFIIKNNKFYFTTDKLIGYDIDEFYNDYYRLSAFEIFCKKEIEKDLKKFKIKMYFVLDNKTINSGYIDLLKKYKEHPLH